MEAGMPWGKRPAPVAKAVHGENVETRLGKGQKQVDVDDEKVEEFYKLMRNIRQTRGAWEGKKKKPRLGAGGSNLSPPRKPAFRWEDFAGSTQEDRKRSTEDEVDIVRSWKAQGEKRAQNAGEDGERGGEVDVMIASGMGCRDGTANCSGLIKETRADVTTAATGSTNSAPITENLDLRLAL